MSRTRVLFLVGVSMFFISSTLRAANSAPKEIAWVGWSDDLFAKASTDGKLVLLDLEAVWCHWCHVMEKTSYSDPRVIDWIQKHYIAVKVDQDARPDLSNRYEDYGWPATIVFDSTGKELTKKSRYIKPDATLAMLQGFTKNPKPDATIEAPVVIKASAGSLTEKERTTLRKLHVESYDKKAGGWGFIHKFIYPNNFELAIRDAKSGDAKSVKIARTTLDLSLKIVDPIWGGVYQYSAGGNWNEPHFEKIMMPQTGGIRVYALAYGLWADSKYRDTARSIYRYLTQFLMAKEGGFYTSQDADLVQGEHSGGYFKLGDKERRKLGIPRVDTHRYARENGWVIEALCQLFSNDPLEEYLTLASSTAKWVMENRGISGGGFRHNEKDLAGPYLGDSLGMGRAFLSLYSSTAKREWLLESMKTADFIATQFKNPAYGFWTAKASTDGLGSTLEKDENEDLFRWVNLLFHFTGEKRYKTMADHVMKYLAAPEIAEDIFTSGMLLVDFEQRTDPLHVAIVGPKGSAEARSLFQAALAIPDTYKRIEWYDKSEGPLTRMEVAYPVMAHPAAFLCTGQRCSRPISKPEEVRPKAEQLAKAG